MMRHLENKRIRHTPRLTIAHNEKGASQQRSQPVAHWITAAKCRQRHVILQCSTGICKVGPEVQQLVGGHELCA